MSEAGLPGGLGLGVPDPGRSLSAGWAGAKEEPAGSLQQACWRRKASVCRLAVRSALKRPAQRSRSVPRGFDSTAAIRVFSAV
jgi:hypothetical protein